MKILVKRENWEGGIWMRLPATSEEAEQARRKLERQHPSIMLPFIGAVESDLPELEKRLVGELVFRDNNLDRLNQLAEGLGKMSQEEKMLFQAAFQMESPDTIEQILETAGHLDSYILHPEIRDLAELGRYLSRGEATQLPEELKDFIDYEGIGRLCQGEYGYLTEGGFVEKLKGPVEQMDAEKEQQEKKVGKDNKRKESGIFSVTLHQESFSDRYVRFILPIAEQELAEKKRQAGLTEEIPERVEVSAAVDGLLEHLPPGSILEELNQAALLIRRMESRTEIDWSLAFAALEAEAPGTIEEFCQIIENHKNYELLPFPFLEAESYAHYHLEQKGLSIPINLTAHFDYRRYGQEKIDQDGVVGTGYGVVVNRERPICHNQKNGQELKLYSPLTWSDYEGMPMLLESFLEERLDMLQEKIRREIARSLSEYGERGLAEVLSNQLLSRKVSFMFPDVEEHQGQLWGILNIRTAMELTDREMEGIKEEWKEIAAHGWGEQFGYHVFQENDTKFHIGFWDTERGGNLFLLSEEEFGREVGEFALKLN